MPQAIASRPLVVDYTTNDRKTTVCQLVHGLPVGGAEVLIERIIRRCSDRFRFLVVCLDQVGQLGEKLAHDGFPVVCLRRQPGFDWKCVRSLQQRLLMERVDVIHAHQYTPFAYALAAKLFGRRPPLLFTEHGRFFPDFPNWKRKLFNTLLTERHDRFTAVSQSVRDALVDNEGLARNRIEIVHNGVDSSVFSVNRAQRSTMRAALELTDSEFMVLQVARLDPIKDHFTALATMQIAIRRNPALRLVIVGDGPERTSIEREICSRKLQHCVTMLGMRQDINHLLSASDAFLLTSISEGIPVTILEAMAAGVPVVATSVGGVPEIITHEQTGLLACARAADALAEGLIRLSSNQSLCHSLAKNARRHVETSFSNTAMLATYERMYQEMAALSAVNKCFAPK